MSAYAFIDLEKVLASFPFTIFINIQKLYNLMVCNAVAMEFTENGWAKVHIPS